MRTARLPKVDWTDAPADLNGLVRFAVRWNLVSACEPSHFKCSLPKFQTNSVSRMRIFSLHLLQCRNAEQDTKLCPTDNSLDITAIHSLTCCRKVYRIYGVKWQFSRSCRLRFSWFITKQVGRQASFKQGHTIHDTWEDYDLQLKPSISMDPYIWGCSSPCGSSQCIGT